MLASYRTQMQAFAQQSTLDVWYARLSVEDIVARLNDEQRKRAQEGIGKAQSRDHLQALAKLTALSGDVRRIVADPPMIMPVESEALLQTLRAVIHSYRETLQNDRRHLFDQ